MSIKGIEIQSESDFLVCWIEDFSEELKSRIRDQLVGIYHGFSESESSPEFYSYENTLTSFLDRYDGKSEDTKKGMIGELLSHILIGVYLEKFKSLSVLKNKEERSIKKGFDIVYCKSDDKSLWYAEVKSGRSAKDSSSDYNTVLLKRSKDGIIKTFESDRNSLWESAMIDVTLAIYEHKGRQSMKDLLSSESGVSGNVLHKKRVILISVLYHDLSDRLDAERVRAFRKSVIAEGVFADVMVFSQQKRTFEKVVQFLRTESVRKV